MQPCAIVCLSGGQDSTTALFWAKERFHELHAVCFDYGQRHSAEIDSANKIAKLAGAHFRVLDVPALRQLRGGALTDFNVPVNATGGRGGLPNTFVPGRNLIFFTLAAALAYQHNTPDIVSGVCQTDYSGYPDCRREFVDSFQETIRFATEHTVVVHTPLMFLTKKQTVELAHLMPGCWDAIAISHTCYEGEWPPCGKCPACAIRAKGFLDAGHADPLLTRYQHPTA